MEGSRTEAMHLVRAVAARRIESLHATLDAARMDCSVVADQRPFFVRPECERAARGAHRG